MNAKRVIEYLRARWAEGSTRRALFLFVTSGAALAGYTVSDASVEKWLGWINGIMVALGMLGVMLPDKIEPGPEPPIGHVTASKQVVDTDADQPTQSHRGSPADHYRGSGGVLRTDDPAGTSESSQPPAVVAGSERPEQVSAGWNG